MVLIDGGSAWNLNFMGAVDRCMEQVSDYSKIVFDVILCSEAKTKTLTKEEEDDAHVISNLIRAFTIKTSFAELNNISDFMTAFPDIKYRYLSVASDKLASGLDVLDID